jgi:diguanylate cyclase (GGDEF)-like protein/PAS domain S-box-containing protein
MPIRTAPTTHDDWSGLLGPAADATTEGLVVIDVTGTIRASNRSARVIAGLHTIKDDRLAGRSPHDQTFVPLHPDGTPVPVAEQPGTRAIATGEPVLATRLRFDRRDGAQQWLLVNAVPLFVEGQERAYGAVVSFSDITDVLRAQADLAERERELALLATHAGDLIARHQIDGKIVYAAGGAEALLGFEAKHLVGFWAADVCHLDDAAAVRETHEQARRGRRGVVSYRMTNARDGREMWLESTVSPVLDEHGVFVEAVTTTRDITSRKANELRLQEAEEEARRQRALLEEAQSMADLGSWSTDLETGAESWSPGLYRIFGVDPATTPAGHTTHTALVHPDDRGAVRDALARATLDGAPFDITYRLIRPDGVERVMHGRGAAAERIDGELRRVWGTTQDVTERHQLERQLQYLADHDALTGLFNRRRFEEELDRALASAERYHHRGAILVLDLDGFKHVNDTLGHPVGDELIARLAGTLRDELRESDVIARLGGDEFGVILPEASPAEADAVASKLLRAVERDGLAADGAGRTRVTASVGLAAFDGTDNRNAEELLVEADIAMYGAKKAGRNRAATAERSGAGASRSGAGQYS